MKGNRREFVQSLSSALVGSAIGIETSSDNGIIGNKLKRNTRNNPIGVSTYSFWQFNGPKEDSSIESCIDLAARMGFDGIELLLIQMTSEETSYLNTLKKKAFHSGLDLMGFSTHQSFVHPDKDRRQEHINKTIHQIELAYQLGIPTMRLNTGRWGTSKNFDVLMENKGIEPALDGYTEEDGFEWVIDSIEKIMPTAEKCGVVLGLENHWGIGRTAKAVRRIIKEIDSPWLQATVDTGNFLEDQYEQFELLAQDAYLVQAKTYQGGGKWYTLDIDYPRIGKILRQMNYKGYISLEFEGNADPLKAVPESLELFRKVFYYEV